MLNLDNVTPEFVMMIIATVLSPVITEIIKKFTTLDDDSPSKFKKLSTTVNTAVAILILGAFAYATGRPFDEWILPALAAAGAGTTGYNLVKYAKKGKEEKEEEK